MDNMLILHSKYDQIVLSKNSLSTVNRSSQCFPRCYHWFPGTLAPSDILNVPTLATSVNCFLQNSIPLWEHCKEMSEKLENGNILKEHAVFL